MSHAANYGTSGRFSQFSGPIVQDLTLDNPPLRFVWLAGQTWAVYETHAGDRVYCGRITARRDSAPAVLAAIYRGRR